MDFDLALAQEFGMPKLCGIDEVGRGPLAGPVVAACFSLEGNLGEGLGLLEQYGVSDSKKLTARKRACFLERLGLKRESLKSGQKLTSELTKNCIAYFFIQEISASEIDQINILQASLKAMELSFKGIGHKAGILTLVDGNRLPEAWKEHRDFIPVIKGDSKSYVIGASSIVAKEYRDFLMVGYSRRWPGYDLDKNAGYPTKKHKEAIAELGVCPIHRKSFKGVKEFC